MKPRQQLESDLMLSEMSEQLWKINCEKAESRITTLLAVIEQCEKALIECQHALRCSDGPEQPLAAELADTTIAAIRKVKEGR